MTAILPDQNQVVTYSNRPNYVVDGHSEKSAASTHSLNHEAVTRARIGEKLAALKGCKFAGEYQPAADNGGTSIYFVPVDTLLAVDARKLGINNEDDLFGGSVPHAFMATKSITHGLIHSDASAPPGWTHDFSIAVVDAVLEGYTTFNIKDSHIAATRLLQSHDVRIKPALGIGGGRQSVITAIDQLDAVLAEISSEELANFGVVLEQNLKDVVTYSVGQVQVAGLQVAYYGTQQLTENHSGELVYGGSTLQLVPGNFDTLLQLDLPSEIHLAIAQACQYDAAANQYFPGFIASRRNYDVAQGIDSGRKLRSGVLEQSWRLGGATPAEIAALEAFAAKPELQSVQASSWERYGDHESPAGATIYFRGEDSNVGVLVKYSTVDIAPAISS